MKVFVTGASGFIGRRLLRELLRHGDEVLALSRRPPAASEGSAAAPSEQLRHVTGDPSHSGDWQEQLRGVDAVVALAGEPVLDKRWTGEIKQRLIDSRIGGMKRLCEAIKALDEKDRPKVVITGSAVGYYGSRGEQILDEDSEPGHDFLASLCVEWEAAAQAIASLGPRVVMLRIGVVLGPGGGAIERMLPIFKAGLGGPLGSGTQYMPWVHLDDVIGIIMLALGRGEVSGPLNVTAPEPVPMRDFARALGTAVHRPAIIKTPAFALRLMLGEGAEVLLASQRVVPKRALAFGYAFRHPELGAALRSAVGS